MMQKQPTASEIENVETPIFWRDAVSSTAYLKLGLLLMVLPIASAMLPGRTTGNIVFFGLIAVCGFALTIGGLFEYARKRAPYLMLSPEGLMLQQGASAFFVPWSVVSAVELKDFEAEVPGNQGEILRSLRYRTVRDATAVSVPKAYYEAQLHKPSVLQRGPGWRNVFVDHGETVKIMLVAEMMGADPKEVFRAVDLRWKAFGGR